MFHRVKKERNILGTKEGRKERRKATWISHILRRNSLLKHDVAGKIEVTRTFGATPLYD
jgi:hypothetical protein